MSDLPAVTPRRCCAYTCILREIDGRRIPNSFDTMQTDRQEADRRNYRRSMQQKVPHWKSHSKKTVPRAPENHERPSFSFSRRIRIDIFRPVLRKD